MGGMQSPVVEGWGAPSLGTGISSPRPGVASVIHKGRGTMDTVLGSLWPLQESFPDSAVMCSVIS